MIESLDACTVITMDRLAHARVLAESFIEHHPAGRVWALVVDDHDHELDPAGEPFIVLRPRETDCPAIERMRVTYDAVGYTVAFKPWLLLHVLKETPFIVYLDSDIQVFAPFNELDDCSASVCVTPHLLEPLPCDGKRPSETDVLVAGVFNTGFVGVRRGEHAERFLTLWAERLIWGCVVNPDRGLYIDQRWLDLLVAMADDVRVMREPGYNVAYWNLTERALTRGPDGWLVNGQTLRFYHFSSFDPRQPETLSSQCDRFVSGDLPEVADLCATYASLLHEHGFAAAASHRYPYNVMPCGLVLDPHVRLLIRDGLESGELAVEDLHRDGGRVLLEWLNSPAERGAQAGVTRYMYRLYRGRPDLCAAFNDLDGADGDGLVAWWLSHGAHEFVTCSVLLPSVREISSASSRSRA